MIFRILITWYYFAAVKERLVKLTKLKLLLDPVKNKNFNIISSFSLVLSACGGGQKKLIENTNAEDHPLDKNRTSEESSPTNYNKLSTYSSTKLHHYTEDYDDPDSLSHPSLDQSKSESFLSGHKSITSTIELSGINEIDGLLFPYWDDENKTDFWEIDGPKNIISFSFFDTSLALLDEQNYTISEGYTRIYNNGFYELTKLQKAAIKTALNEFEKVIDVRFVEVIEGNNHVGTLRFGVSQHDLGLTYAQAVPPGNYWAGDGDIWFEKDFFGRNMDKGSYEFATIMHEIGHAMGLAHPHEGGAQRLNHNLDFRNYTLMSYEDPEWAFFGSGDSHYFTISESLMVYDIQALQYMYGANLEHNSGNTRYQLDPTRPTALTIWDSSGEDILDFSAFSLGCDINLNDGAYSTIRYSNWEPINNFGIAFNSHIENVAGSQSSDTIIGNRMDNELLGNDGNDVMYGGDGDDIFDWRADSRGGDDTMYGGAGDDVYVLGKLGEDKVIEELNHGHDIVYVESQTPFLLPKNVEEVRGIGDEPLELTGNGLDNYIRGSNGNDTLAGMGGADKFLLYANMGNDKVIDFNSTEGDEVLLAFGLTDYVFRETLGGSIYMTSDGSSLELIYEFIA